jgi:hypothetical protein
VLLLARRGEGGNINVTVADTLALQNGGSISVVTQGANDTGNINVNAGKAVTIRGGSQINGDFQPIGFVRHRILHRSGRPDHGHHPKPFDQRERQY